MIWTDDRPGSPWDYALASAAIAAALPFIAANLVVWVHRKRSYFRAQGGAPLILTSSIAGLIGISADFIINFHFPRKHKFLLICPLWSFWLHLTFGFWLWLSCQVIRLLQLHRLCHKTTSTAAPSESRILLHALWLWIPGLIVTIVATAMKASVPQDEGTDYPNCHVQSVWKLCSYLILPLSYFTIIVVILFRSKSTKDYVMAIECSHTSEYSLMMVLVIYLLYGVAILTDIQKRLPGRCFLTFCACSVVFINFWVRLGWPVYLCVFKSDSEMNNFEEELRNCGAECLDKLKSARSTGRCSSSLQYGNWILRAINAAMDEASECKERINMLEQKKAFLSTKMKELEM